MDRPTARGRSSQTADPSFDPGQRARRNADGYLSIVMKAERYFIVAERPRLAAITKHPKVAFAEYERELRSMQFTVQAIQQAYLGTRERAVLVLEGWDAAGKGGIVRRLRLGYGSTKLQQEYPIAAPLSHEEGKHSFSASGRSFPTPAKSSCSIAPGTGACWSRGWRDRQQAGMAERLRGDQSIRTNAGRRWRSNCEMFSAHHSCRANPKVQGSSYQPAQTLEAIL